MAWAAWAACQEWVAWAVRKTPTYQPYVIRCPLFPPESTGIALTDTAAGDFGNLDFSKLGGGEGFPGAEDDDDEDDDDMPALEGEEDDKAKAEPAKAS